MIIAGIGTTVWQFVLKDKDEKNNKIKAILQHVNKLYQPDIKNLQDSLEYVANLIPDVKSKNQEDIEIHLKEQFDKEVAPLVSFTICYNLELTKGTLIKT